MEPEVSKAEQRHLQKEIIKRCGPTLCEMIFMSLHQMVDLAMIGTLGAVAISAVGITVEPLNILSFIFFALDITLVSLASKETGGGTKAGIKRLLINYLAIGMGLTLVLAFAARIYGRELLAFMGAQSDTIDLAVSYFNISLAAFICKRLYMAICSLFRGMGNTKISFQINVLSNLVNIVFNGLLIFGLLGFPKLGVVGAAYGTVISCVAGLVVAVAFCANHFAAHQLPFVLKDIKDIRIENMVYFLKSAIPFLSERIMIRLGVIITVKFVGSLGTIPFAAHRVLSSITTLHMVCNDAFAVTSLTFVGEHYARGNKRLAQQYYKEIRRLGVATCTLIGLCYIFLASPLCLVFSRDMEVLSIAVPILILTGFVQPFQSAANISAGALRGAGRAGIPSLSTSIGICGVRPILTALLIYYFNLNLFGAWIAITVDEFFRFVFLYFAEKRVFAKKQSEDICNT